MTITPEMARQELARRELVRRGYNPDEISSGKLVKSTEYIPPKEAIPNEPVESTDPYLQYFKENDIRIPEKDEGFLESIGKGMIHNVKKDTKTLARNARSLVAGRMGMPIDAIGMAAPLIGMENPHASEKFGKSIDYLTGGYTAPENSSYGRTEETVLNALGGMGSLSMLGKAAEGVKHLPKVADKFVKGAGEFISAGTAPTLGNVAATAGMSAAAQKLADNPEYIPGVAGVTGAAYLGSKAKKHLPENLGSYIGDKIGFDTDIYEQLNKIPGWNKVQTLGDYVKNLGIKRGENLVRKLPGLGSDVEERALGKTQKIKEALGQDNVDLNVAPELVKKGVDATEAAYVTIVGSAKKEAINATKGKKVSINNIMNFFKNKKSQIKTEGGEDNYLSTGLHEYEERIAKLQKPSLSKEEKDIIKQHEKLTNSKDFQSLSSDAQQQVLSNLPPLPKGKDPHVGQAHFQELFDLRHELGQKIDWSGPGDKDLKAFYHKINKDLENHFKSLGSDVGKSWNIFNNETTKYFKQSHKTVKKIQKLYDSDDKINAFLNTLPTKKGAKEARIVMKNLGDEAPEFFSQIVHHAGLDKGNNGWNAMKFESWWNGLGKPVQHELLKHSGIPPNAQDHVKKIIASIKPIRSTLLENQNFSETSTFNNIAKIAKATAGISYGLYTGNYDVAMYNLIGLAAVKGASKYVFSNPKFSAWIYRGMQQKNMKGLENWKKDMSKFKNVPEEFKSDLNTLFDELKTSQKAKASIALQSISSPDYKKRDNKED